MIKTLTQYIAERDASVQSITKGKKRTWVKVPTRALGKDNDVTKDIYDMITKTYAPIGGYVDFSKPSDLPSDFTAWIGNDIDKDPDLDAVRFAKKGPGGTKFAGSATDGSPAAKKIMLNKTAKMLTQRGNYGELSDDRIGSLFFRVLHVDWDSSLVDTRGFFYSPGFLLLA